MSPGILIGIAFEQCDPILAKPGFIVVKSGAIQYPLPDPAIQGFRIFEQFVELGHEFIVLGIGLKFFDPLIPDTARVRTEGRKRYGLHHIGGQLHQVGMPADKIRGDDLLHRDQNTAQCWL